MTALPLPTVQRLTPGRTDATDANGRQDASGRQAGELPDVGYTLAGCPVLIFNFEPWATLQLVTVSYLDEARHTWVYGSPQRLVDYARGLRLQVEVEPRDEIDTTLAPIVALEV